MDTLNSVLSAGDFRPRQVTLVITHFGCSKTIFRQPHIDAATDNHFGCMLMTGSACTPAQSSQHNENTVQFREKGPSLLRRLGSATSSARYKDEVIKRCLEGGRGGGGINRKLPMTINRILDMLRQFVVLSDRFREERTQLGGG